MTKSTLFLLAVAAAILTMGAGCAKQNTNNQTGAGENTPSSTSVASTPVVSAPTQGYVDALNIYGKSGYRFEFFNCSGIPGSLNIKRGTKFMIDNRDNESHQIGIGTKTYHLGAYSFAVVSVPTVGSANITCDGGGAAHVNVEN